MIFKGGKEDYNEVILYGIGVWDLYIYMYSVFIVMIYYFKFCEGGLIYYFIILWIYIYSIFFILWIWDWYWF